MEILYRVEILPDIIVLVSFILKEDYPDYREFVASDINFDGSLYVLDVVDIVIIILNP